jgi:hypothetical protein
MEQEKQGFLPPHAEMDSRTPQESKFTQRHELDPSRMLGPELPSNVYPSLHELEATSEPTTVVSKTLSRKPVGATLPGT